MLLFFVFSITSTFANTDGFKNFQNGDTIYFEKTYTINYTNYHPYTELGSKFYIAQWKDTIWVKVTDIKTLNTTEALNNILLNYLNKTLGDLKFGLFTNKNTENDYILIDSLELYSSVAPDLSVLGPQFIIANSTKYTKKNFNYDLVGWGEKASKFYPATLRLQFSTDGINWFNWINIVGQYFENSDSILFSLTMKNEYPPVNNNFKIRFVYNTDTISLGETDWIEFKKFDDLEFEITALGDKMPSVVIWVKSPSLKLDITYKTTPNNYTNTFINTAIDKFYTSAFETEESIRFVFEAYNDYVVFKRVKEYINGNFKSWLIEKQKLQDSINLLNNNILNLNNLLVENEKKYQDSISILLLKISDLENSTKDTLITIIIDNITSVNKQSLYNFPKIEQDLNTWILNNPNSYIFDLNGNLIKIENMDSAPIGIYFIWNKDTNIVFKFIK